LKIPNGKCFAWTKAIQAVLADREEEREKRRVWDASALVPLVCSRSPSVVSSFVNLRRFAPAVWWGSLVEVSHCNLASSIAIEITDLDKQCVRGPPAFAEPWGGGGGNSS